jgi:acyl carrier protein
MSIEQRARQVVLATLGIDGPATGDFSRETISAWDSLKHVAVIFAIEDEFEVQFSEEQMASLASLSAIVEAIDAA